LDLAQKAKALRLILRQTAQNAVHVEEPHANLVLDNQVKKRSFMARKDKTKIDPKEDQFIKFIMDIYGFFTENLLYIAISVGILVVVIGGAWTYYHLKQQSNIKASIAMEDALEVFKEAEDNWTNEEKATENAEEYKEKYEEKYKEARTKFDEVVKRYGGSNYADKALFFSAKSSYQIGELDQAIQSFQQLTGKYDTLFALYAQESLGRCYEQKGSEENLEKALEEYQPQKYAKFSKLPEHQYAVAQVLFNKARIYEKLKRQTEALEAYNELIASFDNNLDNAVEDKTAQLLNEAERLLDKAKRLTDKLTQDAASLDETTRNNIATAQKLEAEGTFEACNNALHLHKTVLESSDSLPDELAQKIDDYEERAKEFIKNLKNADNYKSRGQLSSALYAYDRAVGLDFPPPRKLYEKALLQRDRIKASQKPAG